MNRDCFPTDCGSRRPWTGRLFALIATLLLLAPVALLGLPAGQVAGQQNRYNDANLTRFGTRYVMPRLGGGQGATAVLDVAMNGWRRSHVLVVELGEASGCPTGVPAPRIKAVRCLTNMAEMSASSVTLTVGGDRLGTIAVYSLNAVALPNGCASFDAVKAGSLSLAEWETRVWYPNPGDPMAIVQRAAVGGRMTALAGRPMLPITTSSPAGLSAGGLQAISSLPVFSGVGSRAWVVSQLGGCSQGRARLVSTSTDPNCSSPTLQTFAVGAMGAANLSLPDIDAPFGATVQLTDGVLAVADADDGHAWRTLQGHTPTSSDVQGQLVFPLGLAPITKTATTLWVTNLHPTATAQIDVLMWDGNQKLKLYRDSVPICAGGSRSYDVATIAGAVDPTRQRGNLPPMGPMLGLRVESTNRALPLAPPIAGALMVRGPDGEGGYTGFTVPGELPIFNQRTQRTFGMNLNTVVPNVKISDGLPAMSTVLAVQSIVQPAVNQFTLELWDASGLTRVLQVDINLANGLTGAQFVDLGAIAGRRLGEQGRYLVPTHFRGTAILRGQQNVGLLGVVAMDVPMPTPRPRANVQGSLPELDGTGLRDNPAMGPGGWLASSSPDAPLQADYDRIEVVTGQILPRWPDIRTPSPTPTRTRIPPTRTATATRTETATATSRASATPRPTATPRALWLPVLKRN